MESNFWILGKGEEVTQTSLNFKLSKLITRNCFRGDGEMGVDRMLRVETRGYWNSPNEKWLGPDYDNEYR